MSEGQATVSEEHKFTTRDFIGGNIALDFVNTVAGRHVGPRDRLNHYNSLCSWALTGGVINQNEHDALVVLAGMSQGGIEALVRAKALREAIYRVTTAIVRSDRPSSTDIEHLNSERQAACTAGELSWRPDVGLHIRPIAAELNTITLRLIQNFLELGPALVSGRVRVCAGADCRWLFLDQSKAGRRRWCDMSTCGNMHKVEQFRSLKRTDRSP